MSEPIPFDLLDPAQRSLQRRDQLAARRIPATLSDLRAAAPEFQPDPDLVDALNVALSVGAPLLLTGEPGTGKTQVAYYIAWYFHLLDEQDSANDRFFPLFVRSTTTAEELLYRFDAVAYLHAASDPQNQGRKIDKGQFVEEGPLWRAYQGDRPAVVLIDEIDKAPRDFPNDLLNVLHQHQFECPEKGMRVSREGQAPPVVIITSNSERRLPEPFLRRCIFHQIRFDEHLVTKAVTARAGDFPNLDREVHQAAIERFFELRGRDLRKPPATAELLTWLTVLSARGGIDAQTVRDTPLADLLALSALVKDSDDRSLL